MATLTSKIDLNSGTFSANATHHRRLAAELKALVGRIVEGGDARSRARHVERGKLLPRDRLDRLLDPGAAFLEVGQLAGHELYDDVVPSGGIVTGIGRISGRE